MGVSPEWSVDVKHRVSAVSRRKFTDEFKADAVALVEESGGQIAKVAKELGIYDSSLGNLGPSGPRGSRWCADGCRSVPRSANSSVSWSG